ncbi:MAG: hypothetical protein WCT03_13670 [Candidatus Obscuribacterales bacterium]|jgi:hypothetical protein
MIGKVISQSEIETEPEQFVPTYDYIKLPDYGRPLIGAAVFGLVLSCLVSSLAIFVGGPILSAMIFVLCLVIYSIQFPLAILASAALHHALLMYRMRKHGPAWYLRQRELDLPQAEAFELCLAACTQFERSRITNYDEKKGIIHLQIKGNFWITVDRTVALVVKTKGPHTSVLYIDSKVKLTRFRSKLIQLTWGAKWHPIVFRTDRNLNYKVMNTITNFIDSVPNWDHRHISVQEKLENLDQKPTEEIVATAEGDMQAA